MGKDQAGYGNPPKQYRFKKGQSGNPKGRPRRVSRSADQLMKDIFERPVPYHTNGIRKTGSIKEMRVESWINRALAGNIAAAENVLALRKHAERFVDPETQEIEIVDLLPTRANRKLG